MTSVIPVTEVMGSNPIQAWIFWGLIFTNAQVVFIIAKIAFTFTLLLLSENFMKMIVKQIFVLFQEESFHGGEEVQLHLWP